jgi:hypothetical protein
MNVKDYETLAEVVASLELPGFGQVALMATSAGIAWRTHLVGSHPATSLEEIRSSCRTLTTWSAQGWVPDRKVLADHLTNSISFGGCGITENARVNLLFDILRLIEERHGVRIHPEVPFPNSLGMPRLNRLPGRESGFDRSNLEALQRIASIPVLYLKAVFPFVEEVVGTKILPADVERGGAWCFVDPGEARADLKKAAEWRAELLRRLHPVGVRTPAPPAPDIFLCDWI